MFRIGTTSYIIPADILPNVTYLAPLVDDVQLVLFETDEYGSNLPDAALCDKLVHLANVNNLSYTVHLPLDLRLATGDDISLSLTKARRVIEATRPLAPLAYTVHLDGRDLLPDAGGPGLAAWQAGARRSLETVCGWLADPAQLCVENLEAWDPDAFAPLIEALPVSRTIDVGHFWLTGMDPQSHLERWLPRARVIHLHGIADRDHCSLSHVPPAQLDPVIAMLRARFHGVVTLEVFSEPDLNSSLAALRAALARTGSDGHAGSDQATSA